MAGKVEVQIGQLRSVGTALDTVATRIATLTAKAKAESAAYEGSWGSDDFGTQFSGGDNGYAKSEQNLVNVLDSKLAFGIVNDSVAEISTIEGLPRDWYSPFRYRERQADCGGGI
ncbi:hypothetical protein [Nocardia acidivorans]|uniref:hypothetical protein n=1 Tax=Nocardia acidivorans TaxID=404580 RepID=UPI000830565D|nr:hypothetical protein [Nocardia acidivorans]